MLGFLIPPTIWISPMLLQEQYFKLLLNLRLVTNCQCYSINLEAVIQAASGARNVAAGAGGVFATILLLQSLQACCYVCLLMLEKSNRCCCYKLLPRMRRLLRLVQAATTSGVNCCCACVFSFLFLNYVYFSPFQPW